MRERWRSGRAPAALALTLLLAVGGHGWIALLAAAVAAWLLLRGAGRAPPGI